MDSLFHQLSQAWMNPGQPSTPGSGKKPNQSNEAGKGRWKAPVIAAAAVAAGTGFSAVTSHKGSIFSPAPAFAEAPVKESATASADTSVEPATGLALPLKLSPSLDADNVADGGKKGAKDARQLAGVGVRRKRLFGIAELKVYAFGVFLDTNSVRKLLRSKYHSLSEAALKSSKWLLTDVTSQDIGITVRLVISYKNLKIGQVRHAFEDSLGSRIKEITGQPQPGVLHAFTKLFTDDIELHRGTIIDLSRLPGFVVEAKIDGKTVGSTKSAILSRALFDLYIGDTPFDAKAQESVRDALIAELTK